MKSLIKRIFKKSTGAETISLTNEELTQKILTELYDHGVSAAENDSEKVLTWVTDNRLPKDLETAAVSDESQMVEMYAKLMMFSPKNSKEEIACMHKTLRKALKHTGILK